MHFIRRSFAAGSNYSRCVIQLDEWSGKPKKASSKRGRRGLKSPREKAVEVLVEDDESGENRPPTTVQESRLGQTMPESRTSETLFTDLEHAMDTAAALMLNAETTIDTSFSYNGRDRTVIDTAVSIVKTTSVIITLFTTLICIKLT